MKVLHIVLIAFFATCSAFAQQWESTYVAEVQGFHVLAAKSNDPADVVSAAVQSILADPDICCGKYSSLVDQVQSANSYGLRSLAVKLNGRHVRPDGRPFVLDTKYLSVHRKDGTPGSSISNILLSLRANQPLLMTWHSHLYVIYGAVYAQIVTSETDPSGGGGATETYTIKSLQLMDPVTGEKKVFEAALQNWNGVEELLALTVQPSSN